jgi:hypothetical protein
MFKFAYFSIYLLIRGKNKMTIEYLIATESNGCWTQGNDFHRRLGSQYKGRSQNPMSIPNAPGMSTTNGLSTFDARDLQVYDINDVAVISGTGFDVDCLMIGDKNKIQEVKQELESKTGYRLGPCFW